MDVVVGPAVETVVLVRVKREVDVAVAGGGGARLVAQLVDRRSEAERTDLRECIFARNSAFLFFFFVAGVLLLLLFGRFA